MVESAISIERLFSLGDYKNLKVRVVDNELPDVSKHNMMVNQICDAYRTLFIHQLVEAKLNGTDEDWTRKCMKKLKEIRLELTIEGE